MNARAPMVGVRNGAPFFQHIALGRDGEHGEPRAHTEEGTGWGREDQTEGDRACRGGVAVEVSDTADDERRASGGSSVVVSLCVVTVGVGRRRAV